MNKLTFELTFIERVRAFIFGTYSPRYAYCLSGDEDFEIKYKQVPISEEVRK